MAKKKSARTSSSSFQFEYAYLGTLDGGVGGLGNKVLGEVVLVVTDWHTTNEPEIHVRSALLRQLTTSGLLSKSLNTGLATSG